MGFYWRLFTTRLREACTALIGICQQPCIFDSKATSHHFYEGGGCEGNRD